MKFVHAQFCVLGLALTSVVTHAGEPPATRVALRIDQQPVRAALKEFSDQSGVQVLLRVDNISVDGVLAPKIDGELTIQAALNRLLQNTGLKYEFANDRTVRISAVETRPSNSSSTSKESQGPLAVKRAQNESPQAQRSRASRASSPSQGEGKGEEIEQVIVTAEKKSGNLATTPVPVSVLNPQVLTDTNQVLLRDYYNTIPSLVATPDINGSQALSIRGVTAGGFQTPTVGVTIDDVPFGASGGRGGGDFVPDFDPGDLARIEVLRGPQGTLWGANSMGGLVKYVTADPSTAGVSGRIEAGYARSYNGDKPGYSLRASANLPLSDTVAVRVSGFGRQDPGYIDNPTLSLRGVNAGEAGGARGAVLWTPTQQLSVKLAAYYQHDKTHGLSEVVQGSGLGDWQQNYIAGLGGVAHSIQLYSANINYHVGPVSVASVTGYSKYSVRSVFDFTPLIGKMTAEGVAGTAFTGLGVTGTGLFSYLDYTKVTQEIRAAGASGNLLDWLIGGFYTHEDDVNDQKIHGMNNTTGVNLGQLEDFYYPDIYNEYAAFANLTFHLAERFDVQLGARESHNRTRESTFDRGPYAFAFFKADPYNPSPEEQSGNSFTYLFSPTYKLTPDVFLYARLASGYRPGSPNANLPGLPVQNPDTTKNYELGAKSAFFDHKLTLDASVFYIDWKDIQIGLLNDQTVGYGANGSHAKSEGLELSLEARPFAATALSAWVTYDDAKLTENFPTNSQAHGVSGDRLPYTPQVAARFSVTQDFPLSNAAVGFVGTDLSYVGNRVSTFQKTPTRQVFPAYTKWDVRAGVRVNSWTLNAYATNLANARGLINGGIGYTEPNAYVYVPPRLIGLNFSNQF